MYVSLLQGEVLQGFLFVVMVVLSVQAVGSPGRKCLYLLTAVSLLMAGLVLLQIRFLPILVLLPLMFPACQVTRKESAAAMILPAVLVLALWSGFHSRKQGTLVMISTGTTFRLKTAYNAKATGAAYPYPPPTEPSGLDFVLSHPGQTALLVGRRFLYLWDLKPDQWYLGNPIVCKLNFRWGKFDPTPYDRPLYALGLSLFLLGVVTNLCQASKAGSLGLWGIPYAILLCILSGPLLVFASSRFLVPALPMVVLFQAVALIRIGESLGLPKVASLGLANSVQLSPALLP